MKATGDLEKKNDERVYDGDPLADAEEATIITRKRPSISTTEPARKRTKRAPARKLETEEKKPIEEKKHGKIDDGMNDRNSLFGDGLETQPDLSPRRSQPSSGTKPRPSRIPANFNVHPPPTKTSKGETRKSGRK